MKNFIFCAHISGVSHILQRNYFCNLIRNPSNHLSTCQSVHMFEPGVINVNSVSVHVCHRFHVVKSDFHHQHVSLFEKKVFFIVNTVNDTLSACYVVTYDSPTHNTRKVFHPPIIL